METLWSLLRRNARNFSNSIAIRHPITNQSYTWLELYYRSQSLAKNLLERGITKGDKVAILFPNSPEFVISFFAVAAVGAVAVPINFRLTVGEVTYILTDSDAKALICTKQRRRFAEQAADNIRSCLILDDSEFKQTVNDIKTDDQNAVSGQDLAEILYTSGTTGQPKGVMLSHYAVISVGQMMAYEAEIRPGDKVLLLMPITHSAPLNLYLISVCWAGATVVLGDFSPQVLAELVHQEKITHFFGAPVAYQLLQRLPNLKDYGLSSMKCWVYGGASSAPEQIKSWLQTLPGNFMSVYGLTEGGPNGLALHHSEHVTKAGSIGCRGSINAEVKIVKDNGSEASSGEAGEIALRSATLMQGYYKNPEATKAVLRNGWLLTGDIAYRDEDGYIWIMDRKKDMIISGGVNVYPKEIEDFLFTHPKILDAAVIGIPHPDWGETVCAVVVLKPETSLTCDELRQFCSGRLADYKIPRQIQVVDTLPRNSSGKLLKYILRQNV